MEHRTKNFFFRFFNIFNDLLFNQIIHEAANKNDTLEIYFLLSKRDKIKDIFQK